jgi:predicted CoA-substrate-specific enzyme activase
MVSIGIDVGSLWTKTVLFDQGKIIKFDARRSISNPSTMVDEMVAGMLQSAGMAPGGDHTRAATGAGRKNIPNATQTTEMPAFARAARFVDPKTRMVVDLGGQGVRMIELDANGVMTNFVTNDKCSTGTGCFLDIMAAALGVEPAQMGIVSLSAKEPAVINTTCTVFAESEVVTLVAKKRPKEEIIAGLNNMVAKKVAGMIMRAGIKGDVVLAGGVALNIGIVKAIEQELKHSLVVPQHAHLLGALGAALSVEVKR